MTRRCVPWILVASVLSACGPAAEAPEGGESGALTVQDRLSEYRTVRLTTDVAKLTEAERAMLPHLIRAAQAMDGPYWQQAYGDREALMTELDDAARRLAAINYGPWDRLHDNEPFVPGFEAKPEGANFYPPDMTKEELEEAAAESEERRAALESLYTMVRRSEAGELETIPYSVFFEEGFGTAAQELRAAAALAEDPALRRYLELRAEALLADDYRASDMAWMDMKDNVLDIVVGPVETYEDQLFGYKAATEGLVLVKDVEWSARLARYAALLPELQRGLPVDERYKQETPGLDSDLNAYDVVYYAGDANAGAKAIAVNLPNDEQVQLEKGTRRLQLKNAMRAKFDEILVPIADVLVAASERDHIRFDAFFENVMFHEVAHGLGIKNTVDGSGTVRAALKERASALEEAKADVLGLYMVTELSKRGELGDEDIRDNYVTFFASIFRSVRFGAADAHGRANLLQFGFLEEKGAFSFDEATGTYRVELDAMEQALNELAGIILRIQGDGDYEGLGELEETYQRVDERLQRSLDSLSAKSIPVDVVFEQGIDVLGLP